MAVKTFMFRPCYHVEVEGFIPEGCKRFTINLGIDDSNYVLHFDVRFDYLGDNRTIILNSKRDDAWGEEQRESFFPFQEGSDTKICFQYEQDKIIIQLPTGNSLSFPIRFATMGTPYMAVKNFHLKSVIVT